MLYKFYECLQPVRALLLLSLLYTTWSFAQRSSVQGLVTAGGAGTQDILVVNFTAQTETHTNSAGNFNLIMQTGDLLIVSGPNIATKKIRYTADLVKHQILIIDAEPTTEELDEVVINRSTVTSESLGIPMGKKYTPAERRLKTAGDFKPVHLLGLLGGGLAIDPILNAVNGRTKRLKKELDVEKRELLLSKVWGSYTKEQFIDQYKIPGEHTNGFAYFIIEDVAFADALLSGNKHDADIQAALLSALYIQNLIDEK